MFDLHVQFLLHPFTSVSKVNVPAHSVAGQSRGEHACELHRHVAHPLISFLNPSGQLFRQLVSGHRGRLHLHSGQPLASLSIPCGHDMCGQENGQAEIRGLQVHEIWHPLSSVKNPFGHTV